MPDKLIMDRVKATPRCDWPVADQELCGAGHYVGLYGGEHIAATEFVIGATLVQYGCTATDILIGLIIGNILAVLSFTFLCAALAVDTRLTLYTYLSRILGGKMQKAYNAVLGIGLAALAASGISISGTAIRRIFQVPIQTEWYPTNLRFVVIVLILGAVVTFIAANGFEAVSRFAATCVPWMISLFFVSLLITLPQLIQAVGSAGVHSPADFLDLLNHYVWTGDNGAGGQHLGIMHVIGFAWICNLAWHVGLNDMPMLRFAKTYKYGAISAVGMFVGHFFAWIVAGIMGATASIILSTPLAILDPGEVTFTLLGYTGLIAVIIAGWTTANPTIYRITLAFNVIFHKIERKKLTYILGGIITIVACFPGCQGAADILTYLGLAVEGIGAVCVTEHFLFPKIGLTRYWNLYRRKDMNLAATVSWVLSIVFDAVMIGSGVMHQNLVFIPSFFVAAVSYVILAGLMGAKETYEREEKEEMEYEQALQEYVNSMRSEEQKPEKPVLARTLRGIGFVGLAVFVVCGILCGMNVFPLASYKILSLVLSLLYFICNGTAMVMIYRNQPLAEDAS
ncbi:MAG: hypothetical protein Q4F79_12020 [Eubacteriales bacterium]|nr:hypothetical protein [Eubacteriales bacterium]